MSLTYSIAREWLAGSIGTQNFSLCAFSGGRRGTKGDGAEHSAASYDVFRKEDHAQGVHGGPIPPGLYICRYVPLHETFGECIFLEQTITAMLQIDKDATVRFYDRDGFYIHGRGPHGSDGCVVPENDSERHRLNKAVKNATGTVLLRVSEQGMPLPADIETGMRIA